MKIEDRVTVVSVNFMTKYFIRDCFESFRFFYPSLPFILVDNGSEDESTEFIRSLDGKDNDVTAILNDINRGHGGGLDQGMHAAQTPYVFTIDSDCIVLQGSFLELMLEEFEKDSLLCALGQTFEIPEYPELFPWQSVAHPAAMLFDREKYLNLRPFEGTSAPTVNTLIAAQFEHGYHVQSFPKKWTPGLPELPIGDYIFHVCLGTRHVRRKRGKSDVELLKAREENRAKTRERLVKVGLRYEDLCFLSSREVKNAE